MSTLGKPLTNGRVFIAGEFRRPTDGGDPKMAARQQGYGILYQNETDLAVIYDVGG